MAATFSLSTSDEWFSIKIMSFCYTERGAYFVCTSGAAVGDGLDL